MKQPQFLVAAAALVTLAGCPSPDDQHDGTAVGNPGVVSFALGAPAGDMDVHFAEAVADRLFVRACGSTEDVELERDDDEIPLDGDVVADLPQGTWCTLGVDGLDVFAEGEHVESQDEDEGVFALALSVGTLVINAPSWDGFVVTQDEAFVLELGAPDWIGAGDIGLTPENQVVVDDQTVEHDAVVAALADPSGLYGDPNTDSVVNDNERDAGAEAAVANEEPTEPDPGMSGSTPGCSSSGGGASPIWLLVLGVLGLRRAQRP